MEYTEDFLKKIVQMGTLGYPLSKIINVLDIIDIPAFSIDFYSEGGPVFSSYKKGLDKADFIIDSKLFDMAKSGDLKAMEKYQSTKISQQQRYREERHNHKNKPDAR